MIYNVKVTADIEVSVEDEARYSKDDIQAIALECEATSLMNWLSNQNEKTPDHTFVKETYADIKIDIDDPAPEEDE